MLLENLSNMGIKAIKGWGGGGGVVIKSNFGISKILVKTLKHANSCTETARNLKKSIDYFCNS